MLPTRSRRFPLQAGLWALSLACLPFSGCLWRQDRSISGIVNVAPALLGKAQQPNTVLLVVARNKGGVPVAIHSVVNPQFPCRFSLGPEDKIFSVWNGEVTVTAQLAARSDRDGLPVPEMETTYPHPVHPGDADVRIFIENPPPPSWATARKSPPDPSSLR